MGPLEKPAVLKSTPGFSKLTKLTKCIGSRMIEYPRLNAVTLTGEAGNAILEGSISVKFLQNSTRMV